MFLAGHGGLDSDGFYFIPAVDAIGERLDKISRDSKNKYCIRVEDLSGLASLDCRRLFIVDACNAGRLGTDLDLDSGQELKDLVRRWRR